MCCFRRSEFGKGGGREFKRCLRTFEFALLSCVLGVGFKGRQMFQLAAFVQWPWGFILFLWIEILFVSEIWRGED